MSISRAGLSATRRHSGPNCHVQAEGGTKDGKNRLGLIGSYRPPPWPQDFITRLGRLEDLSGTSLEVFCREASLPEHRARDWRRGETPSDDEVRTMMLWACSVSGGIATLMTDCSRP